MAKTYNDPAKQLARERAREFIRRNLIYYKNPKEVYVACFPGAENEGEEALEVKEIYDPLGIPRRNIVGIEHKVKIAERLRKANLGIEVVEQDADQYFLHTAPRQFDVIYLDYKGQQTLQEALTLEHIASRGWLSPKGILGTTYFGSRESDSMKRIFGLRIQGQNRILRYLGLLKQEGNTTVPNVIDKNINELEEFLSRNNVEELRNAVTHEIANIFGSGTINRPVIKHFFSNDKCKDKVINSVISDEFLLGEEYLDAVCKLNGLSKERNRNLMMGSFQFEQAYYCHRCASIVKELEQILPVESALALIHIQSIEHQQGCLPREMERYEYVSNSGSSMLVDLFAFTPIPKRLVYAAKGLLSITQNEIERKTNVIVNPVHMPTERFINRVAEVTAEYYNIATLVFPERIKLEVSKETPTPKTLKEEGKSTQGAVNRDEIYEFLSLGMEDEAMTGHFGITKMQLAGYKAALSRRKQ